MAARRLHGLIYATIALCCLVVIIISVSLGTDQWFKSHGTDVNGGDQMVGVTVQFGLFKGKKTKATVGYKEYKLKVVCDGAKCMYSCGSTSDLRKQDIKGIISNSPENEARICLVDPDSRDLSSNSSSSRQSTSNQNPVFLNFGLYVMTIAMLGIAITGSIIGGMFAIFNTYRTPVQPILSVFGLYIWNGISAVFTFLAMIFWIIVFYTSLNKNAAISDTLTGSYTSDGNGSFGISFWILILPILLNTVNIGILRFRSWKIIQMEAMNVKVMTAQLESGDILLF